MERPFPLKEPVAPSVTDWEVRKNPWRLQVLRPVVMVVSFHCATESPGELVQKQIAGLHPQF